MACDLSREFSQKAGGGQVTGERKLGTSQREQKCERSFTPCLELRIWACSGLVITDPRYPFPSPFLPIQLKRDECDGNMFVCSHVEHVQDQSQHRVAAAQGPGSPEPELSVSVITRHSLSLILEPLSTAYSHFSKEGFCGQRRGHQLDRPVQIVVLTNWSICVGSYLSHHH